MSRTTARTLAVALCAILTLAACSKTVDTGNVESQVVTNVESAYPDIKTVSADCPSDIKADEGKKFTCTLRLDGEPTAVGVEITEVTGKEITVSLKRTQAIITTKTFVANLKKQLGAANEIDCGRDSVLVRDPNETITCTVTKGGQSQQITFRVADTDGRVEVVK